jgi:type I restriction-modification system DNA methylase subunit
MLSKIATAGQFRTPRHIIQLMVEMTAPQPSDDIYDPAAGTCSYLVTAAGYIRREHPTVMTTGNRCGSRQWIDAEARQDRRGSSYRTRPSDAVSHDGA